jgi:hypothetical protein
VGAREPAGSLAGGVGAREIERLARAGLALAPLEVLTSTGAAEDDAGARARKGRGWVGVAADAVAEE